MNFFLDSYWKNVMASEDIEESDVVRLLMALTMEHTVLRSVTPYALGEVYNRCGWMYCISIQARRINQANSSSSFLGIFSYPEDGSSKLLQVYVTSHPGTKYLSEPEFPSCVSQDGLRKLSCRIVTGALVHGYSTSCGKRGRDSVLHANRSPQVPLSITP
jgi:hypothetical protein